MAQSEARSREEVQSAVGRAEEAERARREADARAASAEEAQGASSGTVALLKAALSESQRRLGATKKALDSAAGDAVTLRPAAGGLATSAAYAAGAPEEEDKAAGATERARELLRGVASYAAADDADGDMIFERGGPAPTPAPSTATPCRAAAAASAPSRAELSGLATGSSPDERPALPGLGQLRNTLLDSLRAERSKLERERNLLER